MRYFFLGIILLIVGSIGLDMVLDARRPICPENTVTLKAEVEKVCFDIADCSQFGNGWVCKVNPTVDSL